jgi:hypothetical protein
LPTSNAAAISQALAKPTPLASLRNSFTVIGAILASDPPAALIISSPTSIAVRPGVPVRRKMASNSASLNASAPRCINFSRGRSSSGQSLIFGVATLEA